MGLAWFKRRYATRDFSMPEPWAEAHGYSRDIAPRCHPMQPAALRCQASLSLRNPVGIHTEDALQKLIPAPCSAMAPS